MTTPSYEDLYCLVALLAGTDTAGQLSPELQALADDLLGHEIDACDPREAEQRYFRVGSFGEHRALVAKALFTYISAGTTLERFFDRFTVPLPRDVDELTSLLRTGLAFGEIDASGALRSSALSEAPEREPVLPRQLVCKQCTSGLTITFDAAGVPGSDPVEIEEFGSAQSSLMSVTDELDAAPLYVYARLAYHLTIKGVATVAVCVFPCANQEQANTLLSRLRNSAEYYLLEIHDHQPRILPNEVRLNGARLLDTFPTE